MRTSLAVICLSLLPLFAASTHAGPEYFPIKPIDEKNETRIVVSDSRTEFSLDGKSWSPAVATWVHPSWAVLPGATWIWRMAKVSTRRATARRS
jgi:hypothetical protein